MSEDRGEFNVTSWDEKTYAELESGKLTRAEITAELKGDIVGTGAVTWLMCYRADGTADYVGYLNVDSTVEGRKGGFVIGSSGTFDGKVAAGPWDIVEGSGRGELSAIAGAGSFESPREGTTTYHLSYDLG